MLANNHFAVGNMPRGITKKISVCTAGIAEMKVC